MLSLLIRLASHLVSLNLSSSHYTVLSCAEFLQMSTGGAKGNKARVPSDGSSGAESPGSSQLDWLQGAHAKNIKRHHNLIMCHCLALGDSFTNRQEFVVKTSDNFSYSALFSVELISLWECWPVKICKWTNLHISQGYTNHRLPICIITDTLYVSRFF